MTGYVVGKVTEFADRSKIVVDEGGRAIAVFRVATLPCYSSGWPHATFDPRNWVVESPGVIDESLQRRIFSENARAFCRRIA
jgi:hypothetical protein